MYGGGAFTNPKNDPAPANANVVAAPLGGTARAGNILNVDPERLYIFTKGGAPYITTMNNPSELNDTPAGAALGINVGLLR